VIFIVDLRSIRGEETSRNFQWPLFPSSSLSLRSKEEDGKRDTSQPASKGLAALPEARFSAHSAQENSSMTGRIG